MSREANKILDEIIGERFTFGDSGDATYYLFEWSYSLHY